MDLGATLQQAREARRLTCEQLARATRIPLRIILAMEQDEWRKVPGGLFTRGYLRAYAKEVGLDGDALAARFEAEHAPPPVIEDRPATVSTPEPRRGVVVLRWRRPALPADTRRWLTGPALVALLLLVYVGGRYSTRLDQPPPGPLPTAPGVPTNALGGETAHPVGTAATAGPSGTPATMADVSGARAMPGDLPAGPPNPDVPLVVEVFVTRPCWVAASADGERAIYRVLQPGERVQARGRVLTLRVGDAGALQLSLDGERARPLGASGEVVTVRITRENYRSLLPSRSGT